MLTVALIGPDGAGKTTVGRRVVRELAVPARYLYLGVNFESGSHLLPTTRLAGGAKRLLGAAPTPSDSGPPVSLDELVASAGGGPRSTRRRALKAVRSTARLGNRIAEEWYQQAVARWHLARGRVVVFDRHYLADYAAHDMSGAASLPLSRRIHGALLRRAYPRPDVVVLLDAPPEVLLARKGEGTVESLQRRRNDYLAFGRTAPGFTVVDASRPLDEVVATVAGLVDQRIAAGSAS